MQAAEQPNAYEEARRARVHRNARLLLELGLVHHIAGEAAQRGAGKGTAGRRQRASPAAAAARPPATRLSRRLRGETPENMGTGVAPSNSGRRDLPRLQVDTAALERGCDNPALDAHNLMRVKSMSDRALHMRIWKIRRADKLHSFARVLDAAGKAELAAEAREALVALVGGGAKADATL